MLIIKEKFKKDLVDIKEKIYNIGKLNFLIFKIMI